ncbi:MAG: radical SAM family heme chaperone HemW [Puniceicoccales bacterium]|jgi:oxygen-independent coproporphyrinogen-3 oxidase|nr:radical SAM family heme chaperone HemW [Puniceicoccales bacterium]
MQAQATIFLPMPLGLYVHVPFCSHRCDYCAFYQEEPRRSDIDLYLRFLEHSLKMLRLTRSLDTIYWGGGTPGILMAQDILFIGKWIQDLPHYRPPAEWTVELAPHTVKAEKLMALKEIGVNRISMGVQSFSEKTLQRLGRRQDPIRTAMAYDRLREYEFNNIGLDLMFAIPGQTLEEWQDDLTKAIDLNPEHISTYNLTLEGNSKMNLSKNFNATKASIERERKFYLSTVELLESFGYKQYEISNFCRTGWESKHNLHTWQMAEWIGIGPSASSQYDRRRYTQYPSLRRWAQALQDGRPSFTLEKILSDKILFEDSCIFGLRMRNGIDLHAFRERYSSISDDLITLMESFFKQLISSGYMQYEAPSRYRLTLEGLLRCDAIGAEILALST